MVIARSIVPLLLLFGCSCGASAPVPPPTSEAVPAYSVHEWGVVRGGPLDTLDARVIADPAPALVVLKPVLYFHLADATRGPVTLTRTRVSAVEGDIREHFPVTEAGPFPPVVDWGVARIQPGGCATPLVTPSLGEPPCSSLPAGEFCESLSLDTVVTSDADCVVRGESETPFLFYRSSTRGLTVPLRASRLPNGELSITNDGELPIAGRVIRIRHRGGELRVADMAAPAPHASVTSGETWSSPAEGMVAITEALTALGLSRPEIDAFHNAWDSALFSANALELDLSLAPPADEESIFYFLPPELVEHIATIELTPPPTEIRRAMAVWTAI